MKNKVPLIINSDDYGISNSVNKAIALSFDSGLISSTTMMANMPGFDDAVNIAHTKDTIKNKIGLHMNLTEGQPLTDLIKSCPRFCNQDGIFIYNRQSPIFLLGKDERIAVYAEIKAQLSKLIKHNIFPTHLDSHHHVHTEFGILQVYLQVAKEYNIKKIRLSKNIGKVNPMKNVYKSLFNSYLRHVGKMVTTDFFCSADEYIFLMNNSRLIDGRSYEVMVHAKMDSHGAIVDICNSSLEKKISQILSKNTSMGFYDL